MIVVFWRGTTMAIWQRDMPHRLRKFVRDEWRQGRMAAVCYYLDPDPEVV